MMDQVTATLLAGGRGGAGEGLMVTLGQLGDLDAGSKVPALPDAPVFQHYLLENPYPLAMVLVVAGVVGFVVLNRRSRARAGLMAGVLGIGLGVVVWLVGNGVTTTRELLIRRSVELVGVTSRADVGALGPLLAEDVTFTTQGTGSPPIARGLLLSLVQRYPGGRYPVKEHSVRMAQAVVDSPNSARTQVRVRAVVEGIPNGSWWRLHWRCDGDKTDAGAWHVTAIELMQIDGVGDLRELPVGG